jgi:hypothetical protein
MVTPSRAARAFVYRGGVRIAGTVVACDAFAGTDLVFVSHAPAPGARGRRALPPLGRGRRQLLATDVTLALLGPTGERMRRQALVAAYGRPFLLGDLRLELFASGLMPGAASLLCERSGRRLVYAGPIGAGPGVDVRAADALCLDASGAIAGATPPPADEGLVAVGQAVRAVLADGRAPVLVAASVAVSLELARALAADRIALRGHRTVVQAAAAYRQAGLPAPPIARFDRRLGPGEVLLWPAAERIPGQRGGGRAPGVLLVGRQPAGGRDRPMPDRPMPDRPMPDRPMPDRPMPDRPMPDRPMSDATVVPFAERAGFAALLAYVEATGADEVALVNAPNDELMQVLRGRGTNAYPIGPPRQASLFAADAPSP